MNHAIAIQHPAFQKSLSRTVLSANKRDKKAIHLNGYRLKPRSRLGAKAFGLLSLFLIIGLVCFYIIQIGQFTKMSYMTGEYENKIRQNKIELKNLKASFYQGNNLTGVEDTLKKRGYQKIDKIYYVEIPGNIVAAK